ncbi:YihY/virulence factor BrkB family protein [Kineococcus sp. SYSU DK004]|uniref:YihY/virulence factor BrkB family protein n=1 Tax=Kineococcus sp. SYSU DK004 TaxID=3383125 RepID=UPI003D7C5C5F
MALGRADAFQRRHRVVGYPLAVVYKFFEDQGVYLAALITFYALLSLFPLLLLLSTVVGYVLSGDPQLQRQVLDSAAGQFPVLREDLQSPGRIGGGAVGLVVGTVGALVGAMGVGLALQNAVNVAWAVPRNERPDPLRARVRSLQLIVTAGAFVVATTVLGVLSADAGRWLGASGALGAAVGLGTRAASAVLAGCAFALAFRLAAAHRPPLRAVLPGGLLMGVVWQVLQYNGAGLVAQVGNRSSATNTVFTIVLGLLVFLYVAAVALVLCVEADVVRARRLYPRALLTPVTDAVELTEADERTYTGHAQAQRHKGFERVHVTFEREDDHGGDDGPDPEHDDGPGGGPGASAAGERPEQAAGQVPGEVLRDVDGQQAGGQRAADGGDDVLDAVARREQPQ